jgi:hypothetical protein
MYIYYCLLLFVSSVECCVLILMPLLLYLILQQALLLEFRIGVEKKRKKDLNLNEEKHVDRYAQRRAPWC